MKRYLSVKELREVQLQILQELDSFCRKHHLFYSLAYGTLLGAVRHKGFIPWDDDVDILMPLKDLLFLKENFRSEFVEYVDYEKNPFYTHAFPRLVSKLTKSGRGGKYDYGVFVDLYVFVSIPSGLKEKEAYFREAYPLYRKRDLLAKWSDRIRRVIPFFPFPGLQQTMKALVNHMYFSASNTNNVSYFIIAGPLSQINLLSFEFDLFSNTTELFFENQKYIVISEYDFFLSHSYGDYMTLPPEDERHPYHGISAFWA